jgi:hypothetical protein
MRDEARVGESLPEGVVPVRVVVVPMGVDDVGDGLVGDLPDLGDHGAGRRRVDVGVDDEYVFVVDDDDGIAVDGSGQGVGPRVRVEAVSELHPLVPGWRSFLGTSRESGQEKAGDAGAWHGRRRVRWRCSYACTVRTGGDDRVAKPAGE